MALGIPRTEIVWIALILVWHARFYHGNIKSHLGPLRYIIVTPQSHRIHHSVEARHQDRNFGAFLSVWDWAFGTQYRGHTEYPETGVRDQAFPLERHSDPLSFIRTPALQMIYPFRVIGKSASSAVHGDWAAGRRAVGAGLRRLVATITRIT